MAVRALCRTGLAADAVARHVGVGAGVVVPCPVDVVFHHGQQLPADFFGDDLAADVRLGLGDNVAVLVRDGIHDIGRNEVAAVGDGRYGGGHLHRGDGLVLAEGRRVQVCIDLCHLLGVVDAGPAGLVGQVDAGGLGEAKRLNIVVEDLRLQCFGRLNEPEVAAVVQRACHVLFIVDLAVGTAVGVLPQLAALVDGQAAAAVEGLLRTHNTGVQPCRGRDELEHRAGHIQLGNVLILPLGLAHHTLQLGSLAGNLLALLVRRLFMADDSVCNDVLDGLLAQTAFQPVNVLRVDLCFGQDLVHLGVGDRLGVVGVKLLKGRHCQDRTCLDVHDNGASAAMDRKGAHRLGQVLLDDGLYVLVDGQVQVAAVDGFMHVGLTAGQRVTVGVRFGHAAARRTGQRLVVIFFQSVGTRAVLVAEAQHRGQELPVGVSAGGCLFAGQVEDTGCLAGFGLAVLLVLLFLGLQARVPRSAVLEAIAVCIGQDSIRHGLFDTLFHHTVLVRLTGILVGRRQRLVHSIRRCAVAQQLGNVLCRCADLVLRRPAL